MTPSRTEALRALAEKKRRATARRTWRWMERYLSDECGLIDMPRSERPNIVNAIVNTLPDPSLMVAAITLLSSGDGLHKVRVGEKMMTRKQVAAALRAHAAEVDHG